MRRNFNSPRSAIDGVRVRRAGWIVAVLLSMGAALAPAAGCGSDNALVGGDCADGYALCGNGCCPVVTDATTDAETGAGEGGDGGGLDGLPSNDATGDQTATDGAFGDVTMTDASPADVAADGPSLDGTTGEGGPPEAGSDGSVDAPTEASLDAAADAPADAPIVDGSVNDAEAGPTCTPPSVACNGACVDTTSDPLNCGQCNKVCASQICSNSMCVGTSSGTVVFVGHDYFNTPTGTAQARVLSNAVFISQNNPVKVLSYERYASSSATTRVKAILNGVATQTGRGLSITSTSVDADIPNTLTVANYQVLLVHDQVTAAAGALAALGSSWASTLSTFMQQGGIVVILDGGTGVGEMPGFSTATGLLTVTGQSAVATGVELDNVAPGDVVGVGVVSPYGAGKNSVSITTEASSANVIYVVELASDAGAAAPVVVHKLL